MARKLAVPSDKRMKRAVREAAGGPATTWQSLYFDLLGMAPVGGLARISRPLAIDKMRKGVVRAGIPIRDIDEFLSYAEKIPKKEYARIRDVKIDPHLPENVMGRYVPHKVLINPWRKLFNPKTKLKQTYPATGSGLAETLTHEMAHARQWVPDIDPQRWEPRVAKAFQTARDLNIERHPLSGKLINPVEEHAEGVASRFMRSPRKHNYKYLNEMFRTAGRIPGRDIPTIAKRIHDPFKDPGKYEEFLDFLNETVIDSLMGYQRY